MKWMETPRIPPTWKRTAQYWRSCHNHEPRCNHFHNLHQLAWLTGWIRRQRWLAPLRMRANSTLVAYVWSHENKMMSPTTWCVSGHSFTYSFISNKHFSSTYHLLSYGDTKIKRQLLSSNLVRRTEKNYTILYVLNRNGHGAFQEGIRVGIQWGLNDKHQWGRRRMCVHVCACVLTVQEGLVSTFLGLRISLSKNSFFCFILQE